METSFLVGNVITQAGLVTIAGVLIKNWMNRVEKALDQTREELQNNAALLATQVEGVHVELKLANGRTAKLEGKIEVQRAICEERHEKESHAGK
jgi:hypothetical protein